MTQREILMGSFWGNTFFFFLLTWNQIIFFSWNTWAGKTPRWLLATAPWRRWFLLLVNGQGVPWGLDLGSQFSSEILKPHPQEDVVDALDKDTRGSHLRESGLLAPLQGSMREGRHVYWLEAHDTPLCGQPLPITSSPRLILLDEPSHMWEVSGQGKFQVP